MRNEYAPRPRSLKVPCMGFSNDIIRVVFVGSLLGLTERRHRTGVWPVWATISSLIVALKSSMVSSYKRNSLRKSLIRYINHITCVSAMVRSTFSPYCSCVSSIFF